MAQSKPKPNPEPNSLWFIFTSKLVSACAVAVVPGLVIAAVSGLAFLIKKARPITTKVRQKFENPDVHALIRQGDHFNRKEVDIVRRAYLNQTDTLGLVGVVFGPAGTGKSNVVRTVCRREKTGRGRKDAKLKGVEGVIYMEIGSPRQFPYHLAKACGVPVEPSLWSVAIAKMFPTWKTHFTLPSNDKDALALVLPAIAEGGREYKNKHKLNHIPVLFIDGVDILAKQDKMLYLNLVDWAKKCANEDSLRIVFVCSDSHVLVLDQQSFKSRLDTLIEIGDVGKNKAIEELMVNKYGVDNDLAEQIYEIVDGRLTDIHKFVSQWRGRMQVAVSRDIIDATQGINEPSELRKAIKETDRSVDIKDLQQRKLIKGMIYFYLHYMITENGVKELKNLADTDVRSATEGIVGHEKLWKAIYNTLQKETSDEFTNQEEAICRKICTGCILGMNEEREDVIIPRKIVTVASTISIKEPEKLWEEVCKTLKEDKSNEIKDPDRRELIRGIVRSIYITQPEKKDLVAKTKEQSLREMRQAFCTALGKDKYEIKKYLLEKIMEMNKEKKWKTVEDLILACSSEQETTAREVKDAIQEFLSSNVLRITQDRTLRCYNKMAEEVLMSQIKQNVLNRY